MAKHSAVKMDVTVATSDVDVDAEGNVVIRNRELADQMQSFLSSDGGTKMAKREYFLLCCKLRPPTVKAAAKKPVKKPAKRRA
jgi:hypothetical protein